MVEKIQETHRTGKKINRRALKKRRTEVSSSDEDSSSSSSSSNSSDNDSDKDEHMDIDVVEKEIVEKGEKEKIDINSLQLDTDKSKNNTKTEKDILETRLKLRQLDEHFKELKNNGLGRNGGGIGISSDEWLVKMLEQYGDDIETMRTTAADFKGESIALLADLLRESRNVFQEV